MECSAMTAVISCEDHAEMLVFERTIWGENDELIEISVRDSWLAGREYQGVPGRFRRGWRSFWAKPVCHAGIVVTDKARAEAFLRECLAILAEEEGENEKNHTVEQAEQAGQAGVLQPAAGKLARGGSCDTHRPKWEGV